MSLLLVLYLAPVLAVALFWRARRRLPDAPVWRTLAAACEGRSSLLRSTAGALLFATVVAAAATGASGALAFVLGVAVVVFSSALAIASTEALAAEADDSGRGPWNAGAALGQAMSTASVGAVGALAWFFADPSGADVLAAFAGGSSSAALFLSMALGARVSGWPAVQAAGPIHSHLPAVAAVMLLAATAEPEMLLPLGGLLAETETLRSELLLLPIAATVVSPLVALAAVPAAAILAGHREPATTAWLERSTALLVGLAVLVLVGASGLAWIVAAAFVLGVLARQAVVLVEQLSERSRFRSRRETPTLVSSLVSAAALVCGERLAGGYGATLAALGMTAGFASACAAFSVRAISPVGGVAARSGPDLAEAAATVTTTLALLVVVSPVLVAESAQNGLALTFVATAAPALLAGVLAGSACAAAVATRLAEPGDDTEAVVGASRAVMIAAGLPAAAGLLLGAGAAIGVTLGFLAWSAASASAEAVPGEAARLPRGVLLAWGRTMAISALVAVPAMT